jgi:hypothetical protein
MNQAQLNKWFIKNGYPETKLNSFKYGMPFRVIEGDYE